MRLILYILAIIITLGAGWLTYENRENLIEQQEITASTEKEKIETNDEQRKQKNERDARRNDVADTKKSIAETESTLASAIATEGRLNKSITSLEAEIREIDAEQLRYDNLLAEVDRALAQENIRSIEEVPAKIEELRLENEGLKDTLSNLKLINESLRNKIADESAEKASTDARLSTIKTRVSRNAMVASITSVNPEWGFVVINAGSANSNIESNTELVVKRGGQYLGKIKAAAVSPTQTICDIDGDGVGGKMRAGDTVILRTAVVK